MKESDIMIGHVILYQVQDIKKISSILLVLVKVMVFSATLNNISAISCWSVLLLNFIKQKQWKIPY